MILNVKKASAVLIIRKRALPGTIATKYVTAFDSPKEAWEALRKELDENTIYIELQDHESGATFSWNGGKWR